MVHADHRHFGLVLELICPPAYDGRLEHDHAFGPRALLFGLSPVFDRLNEWLAYRWHNPEPADFALELVLGVVMVVAGSRIAERRRERQTERNTDSALAPASAFGLGFVINVVGFPGALPFFAAADQILRADLLGLDIVVVVVLLVVLGLLMIVDAGLYFLRGTPLLPT